jgi:hypothetical protein
LLDTVVADGKLEASVNSFSFFTTVVINFPLPILQFEPFKFTITTDCAGQDCSRLVGSADVTFSVVGNGGQLPSGCENATAQPPRRRWKFIDRSRDSVDRHHLSKNHSADERFHTGE